MKAKVLTGLLSSSLCLIFLLGCDYRVLKEAPVVREAPLADNDEEAQRLHFALVRERIFEQHCTGCHSAYNNYQSVKASLNDIVDEVMSGRMPKNKSPLNSQEKELLLNWIEAGAPEFTPEVRGQVPSTQMPPEVSEPITEPQPNPNLPVEPAPEKLSYALIKSQVIDTSCVRCHSAASGNRGGVNLETYAEVVKNAQSIFAAVEGDFMPPRTKLTLDQKQKFLSWIELGMPEN